MMSFRAGKLAVLALPPAPVFLLAEIAELKGRQLLFAKQTPETLEALEQNALVESVVSSNRIEGVTVSPARLRPLVLGGAKPQDRSEEDIQGYRRALQLIHADAQRLPVSPKILQRLHALCLSGAGDAGRWKRVDNDIVELRPGEAPRVRFRAVPAEQTAAAVKELCSEYAHDLDHGHAHPLVVTAAAVLDFTCIHPFRDGNGRVSRLLTLLALYHHGVEVGRFVSLERLVEERKEDYYRALFESSQRWHEGRHDLVPWLVFFLSTLRRAYRELEERAEALRLARGAKTNLIEAAVAAFPGSFTFRELCAACPAASSELVRKVLQDLRASGRVRAHGRGPGTRWSRT